MAEPLKLMYSPAFVNDLGAALKKADETFDQAGFTNAVLNAEWENMELKARTNHIAAQMVAFLPYPYPGQIEILTQVAPEFSGLTGTIFPTVVEHYGIDDFETSLKAMEVLTPYSTSEFAIRPFLAQRPETIETLYTWSKSDNHHVRRLASEGCRPLLPWAMKLEQYVQDPSPIIPILERLRNDPEDYVYRSVANNLNDISKNHPDLVLDLCEKWVNETKTTARVAKHALRTLLKKGNQRAMKMFGFDSVKTIQNERFAIQQKTIKIGEQTLLDIACRNNGKKAKFRFEYVIGYLKKNGKHSEKVFQLRETTIDANERLSFSKKLDFKDLSTRKHYPGEHYAFLKINGKEVERLSFVLKPS